MRKLYVLPFDHRGSFAKMFGMKHGSLTAEQVIVLKDYKHVIYEGFLAALNMGISKEDGAILVDEELGTEIHKEAQVAGITRILTVEKSGQDEFDFEYGDAFGAHIKKLQPNYVKALVRYNPRGDVEMNKRQAVRLKKLGDFCVKNGYKFLFELLATPTEKDINECGGKENYDDGGRWKVMIGAIRELKCAGVEPDIWKLEGLNDEKQFATVVEEARKNDYSPSGVEGFMNNRPSTSSGNNFKSKGKEISVIVLGRGESDQKVRHWLEVAAGIPGVIGMAVGRTIWSRPLSDFAAKKISRSAAAERIAKNYKGFVELFESER
ncbi:MAG: DUF2090 domain-containing protein [Patescibacteria group bacterium]